MSKPHTCLVCEGTGYVQTPPKRVDPDRADLHGLTGFYCRAMNGDKWVSADIAELDRDSLRAFLRSRGGENLWAENIIAGLFRHEPWEE